MLLTRIDDENLKTTADRRVILHSKEIERLNTQTTAELLEKELELMFKKVKWEGEPRNKGF